MNFNHIVVGLGNPGKEYENTRHNTGRIVVETFRESSDFPKWEEDKKGKCLVSEGKIGKKEIILILPETFMNKSGLSVGNFVKNKKSAENLIVVHDDLDIPFGKFKISFNKSSGGHKGVESIMKAIKTEAFIRIRFGISRAGAKGSVKKPKGEDAVGEFILGKFKQAEITELKKLSKKATEAVQIIIKEGREKAMGIFNQT